MTTLFRDLVDLFEGLAATRSKVEKAERIAAFLHRLDAAEIEPAVLMILGKVFADTDPRALDISGTTLGRVLQRIETKPQERAPLPLLEVRRMFEQMAEATGSGSRRRKQALLAELLSRADPRERIWLVKIIFGEMQHGVAEGVLMDAIARASGARPAQVRRAVMLAGNIGEVAALAVHGESKALDTLGLRLFRPLQPMLADLAETVEEALAEHGGRSAFEFKFDGARVQIHRQGREVKIYSRRLSDVTESLPDVVQVAIDRLAARSVVVEGEVVAVNAEGRPLPFQELMRRFRRIRDVETMISEVPVKLYLFDVLFSDGEALIDNPYRQRWERLSAIAPPELLADRLVTDDATQAERFLERAMAEGHEGLMAKALDSTYEPGSRGKKWLKIKPAEHLDLVIVAAEWGYGRRTGWLSNYHLGARDPGSGEFRMIGKTFKGLTDEQFRWMTERLLQLKTGERKGTVVVKPEIVVEVAFNEIQRSPHYRSGFALRFARIKRIRTDKSPEQADTIDRVRELYEKQFQRKGRLKGAEEFK